MSAIFEIGDIPFPSLTLIAQHRDRTTSTWSVPDLSINRARIEVNAAVHKDVGRPPLRVFAVFHGGKSNVTGKT